MLKSFFYSTALFVVGALALVLPSGYSIGFYGIVLVSLVLWFNYRDALWPRDARYLFAPMLAYALVHLGLALHEKPAWRELNDYLCFMLLPFGVWGLRKFKPKATWFWLGLAVGAVGAALLSGYQAYALGLRAGGHTHPIQFGNIALLFGVLCMVPALVSWRWSLFNGAMVLGAIAGVVASVFSQTRGGWLAVVLILSWVLAQATSGWPRSKRWGVIALVVVALVVPALQPNGIVQQRVGEAVAEFNAFFEADQQDTSVGSRLAMWRVAWQSMGGMPWMGHGNQGWVEVRDAAIAKGTLSGFSAGASHLHNEYLNVAFKRGLIGLAFYLAMFVIPMLYFFKPYLHHASAEVRALAMAGMVVPMMFMDFALTQSFLTHNSGRVVLCSLLMCLAALMLRSVHTQASEIE